MLKISIEPVEGEPDGVRAQTTIHGNLLEVVTETMMAIQGIYTTLQRNRGAFEAEAFKYILSHGLTTSDCPAWDPEAGDPHDIENIRFRIPKKEEQE